MYFLFVLWGAPGHRLRGAIVSVVDDDYDDDEFIGCCAKDAARRGTDVNCTGTASR